MFDYQRSHLWQRVPFAGNPMLGNLAAGQRPRPQLHKNRHQSRAGF
jgi:hypothetical protein